MSEIQEEIYYSEQISIPPTLPNLLRFYAKAAIRTQPSDLLKWSTTYFRCLSLNCVPPVKLRLEYPIPNHWNGLTPGWVKTLYFQMQANSTVSPELLLDRWNGACLDRDNLIQILAVGGFTDMEEIPLLRFIALCAGFISNNITNTMILVCKILTEEPEGGSAMIAASVFLDIYRYLAQIDASAPQELKNLYFQNTSTNSRLDKTEEGTEATDTYPVENRHDRVEANTEIPDQVHDNQVDEEANYDNDQGTEQAMVSPKDTNPVATETEGLEPNNDSDQTSLHSEKLEMKEFDDGKAHSIDNDTVLQKEQTPQMDDMRESEYVHIDGVPGIGPAISEDLIRPVEEYVLKVAKLQHDMVMPRNITRYICPLLEPRSEGSVNRTF